MRDNIKSFIAFCTENIKIEGIVIEVGSFQVKGQIGYADLRPFFNDNFYIGVDLRKGVGVDTIHDIHNLGFKDQIASWVLCLDTLEHVKNPLKAVDELKRITNDYGIIIISSVMDFPIHDHPNDYWRFTPEIFEEMLSDFKYKLIFYQGEHLKPHTIIGIASNKINLNKIIFPLELDYEKLYIYDKKNYNYEYNFNPLELEIILLKNKLKKLKDENRKLRDENRKLRENLFEITESYLWKFIKKIRKIINFIFPKNTKREKIYKKLIQCLKKFF